MDYEKMYNSFFLQVYSYVMTIVKDQSLAEEITQNTFFKAMTAKNTYEGKSGELTWLCGIAKNLAIDEWRKNSRHTQLDEDVPQQQDGLAKEVEDKDSALRIHMVLHELTEPYKEVFSLRVFGELSFSQIGQLFGKSDSWARLIFYRAKTELRRQADENDL